MCRAKVNGWMYKYFSYRIMWTDDAMEEARACPAWLGAAGPHGVVPFANVLSVPAINTVVGRKFVGGTATSVHNTPFLRFMCMYGMTDVKPDNLARQLESGTCVGIVPDGIAGIFKCSREKEVFFIKERKGVAKFCLRTGHPVIPAYSVGNTEAFTAIFDRFGAMEWLSRKLQVRPRSLTGPCKDGAMRLPFRSKDPKRKTHSAFAARIYHTRYCTTSCAGLHMKCFQQWCRRQSSFSGDACFSTSPAVLTSRSSSAVQSALRRWWRPCLRSCPRTYVFVSAGHPSPFMRA